MTLLPNFRLFTEVGFGFSSANPNSLILLLPEFAPRIAVFPSAFQNKTSLSLAVFSGKMQKIAKSEGFAVDTLLSSLKLFPDCSSGYKTIIAAEQKRPFRETEIGQGRQFVLRIRNYEQPGT